MPQYSFAGKSIANPSAIQKYTGLKHADDKHDAFWLAEMLRLEILPEGYMYPGGGTSRCKVFSAP